jgi:DNA-directed RNA polymerase specialized sigma24 family protein
MISRSIAVPDIYFKIPVTDLSQNQHLAVLQCTEYDNHDINAFRPMLFSIAYNMPGTTTDAEDILQETYINWLNTNKVWT